MDSNLICSFFFYFVCFEMYTAHTRIVWMKNTKWVKNHKQRDFGQCMQHSVALTLNCGSKKKKILYFYFVETIRLL